MDVAETLNDNFSEPLAPDLSHLITEDDKPVDNRYSERQYTLLSLPLFDSWDKGKPFEALTDVGLFYTPSNESVVSPDFLLSLGVVPREVSDKKEDRSYFIWLYGKPPNLVVEIVSNRVGDELTRKYDIYEKIGVSYYAVYDPFKHLGERVLRLYKLVGGRYVETVDAFTMPELGLGFILWKGSFLDVHAQWLRFVDEQGELILTGAEQAEIARSEANVARSEANVARSEANLARSEAESARLRLEEAEARAEELSRKLKELGH